MPKIAWAVDQADSDARWLPLLASHLPVRIPVPLHVGEPGAGYPWQWTVVPWVVGSTPPRLGCDDVVLARDLAAFVRALHGVDPAGGPFKPPGSRGSALLHADEGVRRVLPRLAEHDDGFDVTAAEAAWDACLAAPGWDRDPVWIHGDLQPGNLITDCGRLAAVIDFGALGVGVRRRTWLPRCGPSPARPGKPTGRQSGTTTLPGAALRLGPGTVADRPRLLPAYLPANGRARPPNGPRSDRRTGVSAPLPAKWLRSLSGPGTALRDLGSRHPTQSLHHARDVRICRWMGVAQPPRRRPGQEIAAFTSSATFFSTAGLHFCSAYDTGHRSPSSRLAASWKPSVE